MGSCPESPSAKSSASSIPAFVPSSRPPLPVMALCDKIVDKIRENRVTLIVGDTGCGKSSQVPQFLLEENMEPILCTQPRRFAVVAIARMVAKARNCDVGGEVGYHIGHSNVSDMSQTRSRLVFKTAGVLLEQMRDMGTLALNYKVIILDEVHERSVESDLVLACVKQFMTKNTDLRVVLMSATADISRYRDYFNDLGRGERVEVIAIPSTSQNSIFQRNVLYLEKVADLLGISSESLSERYCSGLSPSASADMKPEVYTLIHKLVLHIHENEPDIKKSILVFLPTYYSLEQQWILLKPLQSTFKIHILHRSIDTDQALLAMRICKSHRKVILATNIAESSVTIPGVAYVIDSCRSLQVFWDANRKTDSSMLVWVSKSQADQRKGRTGRTCDGQIYRLIMGNFYNNLRDHEYPAILRLSLRQHVLMICCAESKAINDPKVLLHKVLDPPDSEIIEDAISLLVSVHALEKSLSHRGRYEPTFFGRLLDSLPLSFDASVLTLKFGDVGLLREGILISVLMDFQPLPILHPFGHSLLFTKFVDNFFEGGNNLQTGKKETILMGNLCAFHFWQRVFKDKHRLHHLKHILKVDEPKTSHSMIPKLEEEWCSLHNLVQTSLNHVSEIYEDIINTMHRFRPDFFAANNFKSYFDPYTFKHTCLLQSDLREEMEGLQLDEENMDSVIDTRRCVTAPYVAPNDFHVATVSERLKTLIREIRVQYTEETPCNPDGTAKDIGPVDTDSALCRFFMAGSCNKGTQCGFSHSLQAKIPVCKYFLTFEGCRFGDKCFYSHDYGPTAASIISRTACLQEEGNASAYLFLGFLQVDGYILIMNDKDLNFSTSLACYFDPTKMFVSSSHPYSPDIEASLPGVTLLWDVSHPRHLFIENRVPPVPWGEISCVLLFVDTWADDARVLQRMMQNFFELLAIRVLADTLYRLQVILTMNNNRFAQLQVEKLAREAFFYLTHSFPYDESALGKFTDPSKIKRPMQVSAPFSYVFDMRPPIDSQFGDYTSSLRKGLYG